VWGVDVRLVVNVDSGCCLGEEGGCIVGAVLDAQGDSITSMIVGICLFLLVCRWWVQGVTQMVLDAVGLLEGNMPLSTL
jgi:hypothetical protein